MSREEFSPRVKQIVAQRAAYICSNPKCRLRTIGPHSDPDKSLSVGEACHICAASKGGPRYSEEQTSEQRVSISNAIWLCANCSDRIDKDASSYPLELLSQWKSMHETWVNEQGMIPDLPLVEITTLEGLPIPQRSATITSEDVEKYRMHILRLRNENKVDLLNLKAKIHLPEAIVSIGRCERPAGVEVIFEREPSGGMAIAYNGGSVTTHGHIMPTGIYRLLVERISAQQEVSISFITSINDDASYYREIITDIGSEDFGVELTFQYVDHGQVNACNFLSVISYETLDRSMHISEVSDSKRLPLFCTAF